LVATAHDDLPAHDAGMRPMFDGAPTCSECGMLMTPKRRLLQMRKLRRHIRLQLDETHSAIPQRARFAVPFFMTRKQL